MIIRLLITDKTSDRNNLRVGCERTMGGVLGGGWEGDRRGTGGGVFIFALGFRDFSSSL